MTNQQVIDAIVQRAQEMLNAHVVQFGEKPIQIIMPFPKLEVDGIPVVFHNVPYNYSVDRTHCLHHDFRKDRG